MTDARILATRHTLLTAMSKETDISVSELSAKTGIAETTIYRHFPVFEKEGLIIRRPGPRGDRARYILS